MRAILYAENDDRAFREAAESVLFHRFPETRVFVRNPQFYRTAEREAADLIVVQGERYPVIVADYRRAGATVLTDAEFRPAEPVASVTEILPAVSDPEPVIVAPDPPAWQPPARRRGRPRRVHAEATE